MTGGPIIDLDAWAAQVVADPPAPTDDDRLADWAIRATTPTKPTAGAGAWNALDALETFCAIVGAASLIVVACVLLLAIGETLADIRDRRATERDLVRDLDQGVPADWARSVPR